MFSSVLIKLVPYKATLFCFFLLWKWKLLLSFPKLKNLAILPVVGGSLLHLLFMGSNWCLFRLLKQLKHASHALSFSPLPTKAIFNHWSLCIFHFLFSIIEDDWPSTMGPFTMCRNHQKKISSAQHDQRFQFFRVFSLLVRFEHLILWMYFLLFILCSFYKQANGGL